MSVVTPSVLFEGPQPPAAWGETFVRERELLGAVLREPSIYAGLRAHIAPEDFSTSLHERLFDAIPKVVGPDGAIDRSAVPAALGDYAWDAEGGVQDWLERLQTECPVGAEMASRAREIHAVAERRRAKPESIDLDATAWCHRQAALLARLAERSDPLSRQIDWQNVIEELLYVGRSQTAGVIRKMELVFEHLVKLLADPDAPSRNRWRVEIDAFLTRIRHEAKPSMRHAIDLDAAWHRGVSAAAGDLAEYAVRPPRDLPRACPFTLEALTSDTTTVATLLEKLAATGNMKSIDRP